MIGLKRVLGVVWVAAVFTLSVAPLGAQSVTTNPFRPNVSWGELPAGRNFGSTSAVEIAADGNIWVVERCGANTCVGSSVDPVLLFTKEGKLVRSFGSGKFAWPHGVAVDRGGNLWVTDVNGHTVTKMTRQGEVLLTLGTKGKAGEWNEAAGSRLLNEPTDLGFGANGEIFLLQGHGRGEPRMLKFDRTGKLLKTWGGMGTGPGQFDTSHSVIVDRKGLVYVADRQNVWVCRALLMIDDHESAVVHFYFRVF